MKKIALLFCLFPLNAFAQGSDLVSQISGPNVLSDVEVQRNEKQVADDRGIFSFLNFSFIKKTKNLLSETGEAETLTESTPKETPLQRITRQAEEGNLDAQLTLGYVYLYGENGVKQNFETAFKYYEMAAAQKNPVALNNLGSLYFNGIGTKVDYREAAALFAQAAELGSDDAAVNLAFIYLSGDNFSQYASAAIKLFEQSAQAGNNTAKFMWGYANYRGFETPQNYYKAMEFIRQAADAKFDEAQYMMGLLYLKGQGISQNYGNAVRYLRASAAQGNLDALMLLAQILAEGKIYPKNLAQAYIMYNIAAVYAVDGAAEKRSAVEKQLKMEELLQAQTEAEQYQAKPSELTTYVRQTFGSQARRYIDDHLNQTKE